MLTLIATFQDVADPRHHRTRAHELTAVLVIALLAIMCGATGWVEVAAFGRERETWLKQYLPLENGTPSHDTFGRVFARLAPMVLQERFLAWMGQLLGQLGGQHIAIDGKTVRGSHTGSDKASAIHLVNVWSSSKDLFFGQLKVDGKSNEITAIPELLAMLDIRDCLVSIDAMGCQVAIAEQIRQQGGDYLLSVKKNQPSLHQAIKDAFEQIDRPQELPQLAAKHLPPPEHDFDQTEDAAHNRDEVRRVWTMPARAAQRTWTPAQRAEIERWSDVETLVCIESERQVLGKDNVLFHRYYIASTVLNAEEAGVAIRDHWRVENGLHWRLDVVLREDASRVRTDNAPENLSLLRKVALNALKADPAKASIRVKQFQAAMNPDRLIDFISHVQNPQKPTPPKSRAPRSPKL